MSSVEKKGPSTTSESRQKLFEGLGKRLFALPRYMDAHDGAAGHERLRVVIPDDAKAVPTDKADRCIEAIYEIDGEDTPRLMRLGLPRKQNRICDNIPKGTLSQLESSQLEASPEATDRFLHSVGRVIEMAEMSFGKPAAA